MDINTNNTSAQVEQTQGSSPLAAGLTAGFMGATTYTLLAPISGLMSFTSIAGPKAAVCTASALNTHRLVDLTLRANEYFGNPMDVGVIENYTFSYLGGFGAAMTCALDFSSEQSIVNAFRVINYAGNVASFVAENSTTIGLVGAGMFAAGYAIASTSKSPSK